MDTFITIIVPIFMFSFMIDLWFQDNRKYLIISSSIFSITAIIIELLVIIPCFIGFTNIDSIHIIILFIDFVLALITTIVSIKILYDIYKNEDSTKNKILLLFQLVTLFLVIILPLISNQIGAFIRDNNIMIPEILKFID